MAMITTTTSNSSPLLLLSTTNTTTNTTTTNNAQQQHQQQPIIIIGDSNSPIPRGNSQDGSSSSSSSSSSSYTDSSSMMGSKANDDEEVIFNNNNITNGAQQHHLNRRHYHQHEEMVLTPIKSNFLTKEEEEEQNQIIHNSSFNNNLNNTDDGYNNNNNNNGDINQTLATTTVAPTTIQLQEEHQEKQQEELLAFQNQIFFSQTNNNNNNNTLMFNTSNLTNMSSGSTTNNHHLNNNTSSSVMMNHAAAQDANISSSPPPQPTQPTSVGYNHHHHHDSQIIGTTTTTTTRSITDNSSFITSPTKGFQSPSKKAIPTSFHSPLFDSDDLEESQSSLIVQSTNSGNNNRLSSIVENNIESLKIMKKKHREDYLPDNFLHFCKHETSKIYGWSLESEKHAVQFYDKSISIHSLDTGDFSAMSRLTSQNAIENTSTQDLSKNYRFKQTPMLNDSINYVIANRFVGILSDTNFRDAFLACKDVQLRKQAKQMEEVVVLESYYRLEGTEFTIDSSNNRKSKVPDESFDVIYQRTYSPNTLFVSKREYLTARYFIEESDRLIILERSIDNLKPIPPMLQTLTLEHNNLLNEVRNFHQQTNLSLESSTNNNNTAHSSLLVVQPNNHNNNDFSSLSTSPSSRQRSRSVGNSKSLTAETIHLSPLSARMTTSSHILQQSAPNMNTQLGFSNSSETLKSTLTSNSGAPSQKGVVRANVRFQILIFDRLSDTETKFQIINNVDVKGWLKSWNSLTQKSTPHKIFEDFVAVIEEYKKMNK